MSLVAEAVMMIQPHNPQELYTTPSTTTSTSSTTETPPPVAGIKVPKELDVVRVK